MFVIKMQEEGSGKNKHQVKCKLSRRWLAVDPRTGQKKSGQRRNKDTGDPTPGLSVLLTDGVVVHKITWSNYYDQPMADPNPGKFVYHREDKMDFPRLDSGRIGAKSVKGIGGYKDTLSPMVRVEGEKDEFENHARFWAWLSEQANIGPALAAEIQAAFAVRLVQYAVEQAERHAAQRKAA